MKGLGLEALLCVEDAEFEVELEDLAGVRTPLYPSTPRGFFVSVAFQSPRRKGRAISG